MKGVPHYFKDGTKHKGGTHKMPNGDLHSGKTHGKTCSSISRDFYYCMVWYSYMGN